MGFPADRLLRGTDPAHEVTHQGLPPDPVTQTRSPQTHHDCTAGVSQKGARGAETDRKQSPTLAPPCSVAPLPWE